MKRKAILLAIAVSLTQSPAMADVYVAVDANGNAVGGAIVCEQSVCGDPNSDVSKSLLNPGQRFVLQGTGTTGIGKTENTSPKVDLNTNQWTVTHTDADNKPVAIDRFNTVEQRTIWVAQTPDPNPYVSAPPIKETITATNETSTVFSILDEELDLTWEWEKIIAWIVAYFDKMLGAFL